MQITTQITTRRRTRRREDLPTALPQSTRLVRRWRETKDRMTSFNEIVKFYELERRTMPPHHPGLGREEAVLYQQLQTGSLPTPVLMRHVCPSVYVSDLCCVCQKERATASHILWDCSKNPHEASKRSTIPPWFEATTMCYDREVQAQAVQQILAALKKQQLSETRQRLPPQKRGKQATKASSEAAV